MPRHILALEPTSGSIAWEIYLKSDFNVPRIDLVLSPAPSSEGFLYIKKISPLGAVFETVVRFFSPVGYETIAIEGLHGFSNGDKVLVEYANPDGVTISGTTTVDIPLPCVTIADMSVMDGTIRSLESKYLNCQQIDLKSSDPGASGAMFVTASDDYLGGMRLNASTDQLKAAVHLRDDWDQSRNPVFVANVTSMVDNTAGSPDDKIKFKFVLRYGSSETQSIRGQTFYAEGTVGQIPLYYQLSFSKEIDRLVLGNELISGDAIYATLNLEADSDITDCTVNCAAFYYHTTRVGFESGDL